MKIPDKARRIINRLLYPPRLVLFTLPPVVFAALVYVFFSGKDSSVPAYAVYFMSAYCLTIVLLPLPGLLRGIRKYVVQKLNGTAFGKRYLGDAAFRAGVGSCFGTAMNFFHVVFRIYAGIRFTSVWFITIAVYYLVLGTLRLSLIVSYHRRERTNELRCYRRTAWLLFLLNIPMGGMILLMVQANSGFSYPGYMIYLSAMYAFYTVTVSAVNLVKCRRLVSTILSAARVLNFISALMSILALQTAMIARFSAGDDGFRKMMNTITGGCVWTAVILTAAYMLRRSRKAKDEVTSHEQIGK